MSEQRPSFAALAGWSIAILLLLRISGWAPWSIFIHWGPHWGLLSSVCWLYHGRCRCRMNRQELNSVPLSPRLFKCWRTTYSLDIENFMRRKASTTIIFVTVFLDLLGFGIVLPLMPLYALDPRFAALTRSNWLVNGYLLHNAVCFCPVVGALFRPHRPSSGVDNRAVWLLHLLSGLWSCR